MDNNYVKLDILDYNRLLTSEAWAEHYKAENLKLKEEQLKLEEEVSILNSIVDDRLANEEECMTDPSQDDVTVKTEFQASLLNAMLNVGNHIDLADLEIGNNFTQIKKTDLVELNITLAKLCNSAEDMKDKIHKLLINN